MGIRIARPPDHAGCVGGVEALHGASAWAVHRLRTDGASGPHHRVPYDLRRARPNP